MDKIQKKRRLWQWDIRFMIYGLSTSHIRKNFLSHATNSSWLWGVMRQEFGSTLWWHDWPTGWITEGSNFNSPQRWKVLLPPKWPARLWGSYGFIFNGCQRRFSRGKRSQPEADHLLHLVPTLQMSSVIPVLVWLLSWSAQGQFCFWYKYAYMNFW